MRRELQSPEDAAAPQARPGHITLSSSTYRGLGTWVSGVQMVALPCDGPGTTVATSAPDR
jgi:hypothetical protein